MPKKTKLTLEQKRERDRLQKKAKYAEMKKDPEKYAEVKAKERARYLKRKEQKKIKRVEEMTPRQLRITRKSWRINSKRHYERKKKEKAIQQLLLENSPPNSDTEVVLAEQDPLARPALSPRPSSSHCVDSGDRNSCQQCLKKDVLLRKLRYRHRKEIGILKQEIEKTRKQKDAIRKMLYRVIKNKKKNENISTEEKVEHLVENVNTKKREEIKKRLLFGEILSKSVGEGYKCLRKKDKKEFSNVVMIEKEKFKKYKLLTQTKTFTVRDKAVNKTARIENSTEQQILDFFDDDAVTRIAADKKEYITKNIGALWSFGCSKVSLRKLSCFLCGNEVICSHDKHIGYCDIPLNDNLSTNQFKSFIDENTTPELIQEINDTGFSIAPSGPNKPYSPKVKILSDINVTDWFNRKFYIYKENLTKIKTRSNSYQTDFEKFIMSKNENEGKENKEEILCETKKKSFWSDDDDSEEDMNIF